MNGKIVLAFIAGVVTGAAASYLYLVRKAQTAEEAQYIQVPPMNSEINATESKSVPQPESNKPDKKLENEFKKYSEIARKYEYTQHTKPFLVEVDSPESSERPEVEYITPDEFGNDDEYESVFCTFYADDIMTEGALKNADYIIDNPSTMIGSEYEQHIGEHEEDILICVNHRLKEYIEVTFVDEKYNEEGED